MLQHGDDMPMPDPMTAALQREAARDAYAMPTANLSLRVEVRLGTFIPVAIQEMAALAERLGVPVTAELNGDRLVVRPGDDPSDVLAAWGKRRGVLVGRET
jgi:hypothetical protein